MTWQNGQNSCQGDFVITVDRVEGNYAVCEFPDETMCDVEVSRFPMGPRDREKYKAQIDSKGNVVILDKIVLTIPEAKRHKIPGRFIRF